MQVYSLERTYSVRVDMGRCLACLACVARALHLRSLKYPCQGLPPDAQVAQGDTEPLVAVGTALAYGEDHPCTGRVLLYRVKPAPEGAAEGLGVPTGEQVYSRYAYGFTIPSQVECQGYSATLTLNICSRLALLISSDIYVEKNEREGERERGRKAHTIHQPCTLEITLSGLDGATNRCIAVESTPLSRNSVRKQCQC